ncbi:MAG: hypothetical protein ACM3S2_14210 [Ignavibacteriales bacterium]
MKNLAIFNFRNPTFDRCPSCRKTGVLHRSRTRNIKEAIVKKVSPYGLYRCKDCGWRGYRAKVTFTSRSLVNLFYYGLIILAAGFVVWSILKRSDWNL